MASPFDRGRGGGRVVPIEKVRKIASQRDRLADEVEKLREHKAKLEESLESARDKLDKLEERALAAEERAGDLEEALEERDQTSEETDESDRAELEQKVRDLRGDLDRVKKRSDEVDETARREERIRLLGDLGAVLDSVERGLSMQPEGPGREGLKAIRSQLLDFFDRHGADVVGDKGEAFDPEVHEAVDVVSDPSYDQRTVVEVVRPGVVLQDGAVVLPARVRVAE